MRIFVATVVAGLFLSTVALAQTVPTAPTGSTSASSSGTTSGSNTQTTTPPSGSSSGSSSAATPFAVTQAPTGYTPGQVQSATLLPGAATPTAALNIQFP